MFILYDLILLIVVVIYLPIYLFKRKLHRGFLLRLGILPKCLDLNRPVWIHAVSVGEVMAIRKLIDELRKERPEKKIVISTVTPTGNKIAQNIARTDDFVTYLPLDISFIVRKVIGRINPSQFIIAETEIWPNLICELRKRNIPVIIINGRISEHAFSGYLKIKSLLKPILDKISLVCVQSNNDAKKFKALGVSEEKIKLTGNMKFDSAVFKLENVDLIKYQQKLKLFSNDRLLVCGSTHTGEEEIILSVYKDLQTDFSNLKLLIAPRHPERATEVGGIIKKYGFEPIMVSLADSRKEELSQPPRVFVLDTVGQLINYYAIAEIVFVGGSLIKKGGHNILEPASLDKPVLFGPYMFNFQDITELFLGNQAAILVNDKDELETKIRELLNNPLQAHQISKRARELILKNTGSTKKNLELIEEIASSNINGI